jgi:hypothetical protein
MALNLQQEISSFVAGKKKMIHQSTIGVEISFALCKRPAGLTGD